MSAPRLSAAQKSEILQAYGRGERLKDIAARFGVHQSYPGVLAKRRQAHLLQEAEALRDGQRPVARSRGNCGGYDG